MSHGWSPRRVAWASMRLRTSWPSNGVSAGTVMRASCDLRNDQIVKFDMGLKPRRDARGLVTDILDRDATSQLAALAAREVSSVELLEAAMAREAAHRALNAVVA